MSHALLSPGALPGARRFASLLVGVAVALGLTFSGALTAPPAAAATSSATLRAIGSYPVLHLGSRGLAVAYIQKRLHVSPRSGYFGPLTKAAVKRYERRHGLRVNGVVGGSIWKRLGVERRTTSTSRSTSSRRLVPGTASFGARANAVAASTARGAYYRYGGTGPRGFDCSGYTGYVIRKAFGKKLPRTAAAIRGATRRISSSSVRPGDLVFVHRGGRVSHVAIYSKRGYWWEASNPRTGVGRHRAWTTSVSYGRI